MSNALLGLLAMLLLAEHSFDAAAVVVMFAAIADGIDGAVSRRCSAFGPLGKNLDSLSDALSFGMVPAAATYLLLKPTIGFIAFAVSGLFLSCGLLRLARFNVSESTNFQGIPITATGLIVMLFLMQRDATELFPYLLMFLLILLSLLMVSRVEYPKIRDFRVVGLLATAMVSTLIMYFLEPGMFHKLAGVLLVMLLSYTIAPTIGFPRGKNPQEA